MPASSSNRCAVQMIDPRSPLPAHPRAAPGKEKVGGLVGCWCLWLRAIVCWCRSGCMCCLALSYQFFSLAAVLCWTDDHHTVGTTSMCYHVDSRSFFSLHTIPHGQLQTQPLRLAIPQVRSGVRRMKLRRFRTAPISSY